jgi:superfamily II DNA or RNA helicase
MRLEECERAARKALRVEPGHAEATLLLSVVLLRSGHGLEAVGLLHEAIRKHPGVTELYYALADCALGVGRLEEAEQAIVEFLQRLRADPRVARERRRERQDAARALLRRIRHESRARGRAPAAVGKESAPPPAAGPAPPGPEAPGVDNARQGLLFAGIPAGFAAPAVAAGVSSHRPPPAPPPPTAPESPPARVAIRFEAGKREPSSWPAWMENPWSDDLEERALLLEAQRVVFLAHYEDLLCLPTLTGVERLEYQVETARKILRRLGGRALLCDEVGLGKTIEAGMVIKEYLLRGLARSVLVLAPPGLVRQWREEMASKFGLEFAPWGEREAARPAGPGPLLAIGSIAMARLERNLEAFSGTEWDLVVVDEAHHLRRRSSRSWRLVSALRKRFLLLLTATPVHNNLMELYELVTLVRPGLLGTPAEFRRDFVGGKDERGARNPDRLRAALTEVMVRNRRSHADVALPRRFATTLVIQPRASETGAYRAATRYANLLYPDSGPAVRMALRHLLGTAGSGPRAVGDLAARWLAGKDDETREAGEPGDGGAGPAGGPDGGAGPAGGPDGGPAEARRLLAEIVEASRDDGESSKTLRLLELLAGSDEQAVVFCRYRATLAELSGRLAAAGIGHALYHGGLTRQEKDRAVDAFAAGTRVLLSTESGGEGRNIQFCRTIVNYDLPWDPMLIEQRIGRVHRIGQRRDVFVFNLVLAGTLEEELLRILEEKIHLFELIVGEVDAILGHLERREEFADILLGMWAGAADDAERRARFEALGRDLAAARATYQAELALEDGLFADDLEA